jgi:hypothetical protein
MVMQFLDVIHALKLNPKTHIQEAWCIMGRHFRVLEQATRSSNNGAFNITT